MERMQAEVGKGIMQRLKSSTFAAAKEKKNDVHTAAMTFPNEKKESGAAQPFLRSRHEGMRSPLSEHKGGPLLSPLSFPFAFSEIMHADGNLEQKGRRMLGNRHIV